MKLLLITGAGASHNLSADPDTPLPLMHQWADRLRGKFGPGLTEMTGLDKAQTGEEFEETLGALFNWASALPEVARFAEMVAAGISPRDGHSGQLRTCLANGGANMETVQRLLHESLFDEFGPDRIDDSRAVAAYTSLLEAVTGEGPDTVEELVCATTNYDRSLEVAFEAVERPTRTGFQSHSFRTPRLIPQGLGEFRAEPSVIYLHGAVGWYSKDGVIRAQPADAGYNDTLGQPGVLYPGPNKNIERSQTGDLWGEFVEAVAKATHILVVGHALNDEHLVNQLRSRGGNVAVTFHADRASGPDAESADKKRKRIRSKLPKAAPIPADMGDTPVISAEETGRWLESVGPTN